MTFPLVFSNYAETAAPDPSVLRHGQYVQLSHAGPVLRARGWVDQIGVQQFFSLAGLRGWE